MNANVENLILEQLRAIREDLSSVKEAVEDLKTGQRSLEGMIFSMAGYIRDIDVRVEHLEEKFGEQS